MKNYWRIGEPCVWGTGAALAVTLLIALTLIVVVMINGLGVFWPGNLHQLETSDGGKLLGELIKQEPIPDQAGERLQFKVGNRDLYGLDFRWVDEGMIVKRHLPREAITLEREEYGNFYGFLEQLEPAGMIDTQTFESSFEALEALHDKVLEQKHEIAQKSELVAEISYESEQLRLKQMQRIYAGAGEQSAEYLALEAQRQQLERQFHRQLALQNALEKEMRRAHAVFVDAAGESKEMAVADLVRFYRPNDMSWLAKAWFYAGKLVELIFGEPRESNTEGGLFPAIFGTVMLIFIMSLFSFPLGVIAAIYLREYAREGLVVRIVRIAVNNLAGIPSIVYGIFGLGFFVYGIGSSIDSLFFAERLPTPTFGTGGILWASLTLSLLTVPVVIVATEEALGAIPREMREGSLALGSTKFQTLYRILVPMASPGIMTGLILAMARAAGEVAPLMITGVVKLAPALPIDGNFPFVHLDRKFMHLGFHIFDIGFQSPNVEAAKPMVFVTTLLLVLIVLVMSSIAIYLRNKMKKRYTFGTF